MTEPDEKLSGRYRELARDEPPAALDARILAAARDAAARPAASRASRWMGPVSIAAVLVLGIGVSLRMQLENPGVETSVPSAAPSEYSMPSAEQPTEPPAKAPPRADSSAPAVPAPAPKAVAPPPPARQPEAPPPRIQSKERAAGAVVREETRRNVAPEPVPNPFTDAPVTMQAPVPVSPPVTSLSAPPPPAVGQLARPPAPAPSAPMALESKITPQAAPRAKREAGAADAASGARELRKATAEPDPDPLRELERIAALRAAGNHAEADRALEQFRRRHPDFRIPEALWERVRAR